MAMAAVICILLLSLAMPGQFVVQARPQEGGENADYAGDGAGNNLTKWLGHAFNVLLI